MPATASPAPSPPSVYVPIAVTTALLNLGSGALFLQALALWMAQHLATVPLAFLYGIVLGASSGLSRTLGRAHLGSISGIAANLLVLGYALALLGSYDLALTLLAVGLLALGVASLFLRSSRKAA